MLTFFGSIPEPLQKEAVLLSKMLMCTIQSRFARAFRVLPALGLLHAGFWTTQVKPLTFPHAFCRSCPEWSYPGRHRSWEGRNRRSLCPWWPSRF